MRLAIGFAGVPRDIFDPFRRGERKLVEANDLIITETYKRSDAQYYSSVHANFFLREFARLLADDHHNRLADTGFVVIYVSTHPGAEQLAERLFPSVFSVPVEWRLTGHNRTTWGRSLAELNARFRQAVHIARRAIAPLKKELTQQDGRTPWLLPVRNFRSDVLDQQLRTVHERLREEQDLNEVLQRARRNFELAHPLQKIGTHQRPCFVDRTGVEFHPPGSARHGFARGNYEGHPPICLVSGRRRLGSPYHRAFHYDCARGKGVLKGRFFGCHSGEQILSGDPHLNVAPNDFVRR